jgi:hypothetical protein
MRDRDSWAWQTTTAVLSVRKPSSRLSGTLCSLSAHAAFDARSMPLSRVSKIVACDSHSLAASQPAGRTVLSGIASHLEQCPKQSGLPAQRGRSRQSLRSFARFRNDRTVDTQRGTGCVYSVTPSTQQSPLAGHGCERAMSKKLLAAQGPLETTCERPASSAAARAHAAGARAATYLSGPPVHTNSRPRARRRNGSCSVRRLHPQRAPP